MEEAEAALRENQQTLERLVEDYPEVADYRQVLARTLRLLGLLLHGTGRRDFETTMVRARDLYAGLVDQHPGDVRYRQELALTLNNLGTISRWARSPEQILEVFQQALTIQQRLVREYAEVPQYQSDLAVTHYNTGNCWYHVFGRPDKAEAAYRQALVLEDKLAREHPLVLRYQQALAKTHGTLGVVYVAMNQPDHAEPAFRQALAIQEKLFHEHATVSAYALDLGVTYYHLGALVKDPKRAPSKLVWYAKAIRMLEIVCQQADSKALATGFLHAIHVERAKVLTRLGRHAEALADWQRAIDFATRPDTAALQLASTLSRGHEQADVARAVEEGRQLTEKVPASGELFYAVTGVYALFATVARQDARLPRAEQTKLAEQYAACAIDFLTKARSTGWFKNPDNFERLQKDEDLESLRLRGDLKKLMAELEKKPQTGTGKVSGKP